MFKLHLSLVENEVLCALVRMAVAQNLEGVIGAVHCRMVQQQSVFLPSVEQTVREVLNYMDVFTRLTADLREVRGRGERTVSLGRTEFEALYSLSKKDWGRNDGSPAALAFVQAWESCRIGISAAFEAAAKGLGERKISPNVLSAPGMN